MPTPNKAPLADTMAELTYTLLENCQEKQQYIAENLKLSVSEFKCLRSFRNEGILSVKELAKRMNLTSSRMTRIIDGLVEKGYVTRDFNPQDRRVIDVALTKEGTEITRKLNIDYVSIHEDILSHMQPSSRPAVIKALRELSEAMKAWIGPVLEKTDS